MSDKYRDTIAASNVVADDEKVKTAVANQTHWCYSVFC